MGHSVYTEEQKKQCVEAIFAGESYHDVAKAWGIANPTSMYAWVHKAEKARGKKAPAYVKPEVTQPVKRVRASRSKKVQGAIQLILPSGVRMIVDGSQLKQVLEALSK